MVTEAFQSITFLPSLPHYYLTCRAFLVSTELRTCIRSIRVIDVTEVPSFLSRGTKRISDLMVTEDPFFLPPLLLALHLLSVQLPPALKVFAKKKLPISSLLTRKNKKILPCYRSFSKRSLSLFPIITCVYRPSSLS